MFQSKMRCPLEPCCTQLGKEGLMKTFHRTLASMIICWTLSCWKTKLLCSLLGEFGDCILAVGLDDAVGKPVFHDKTFEMLKLMSCWPFSGRDDRAAQAGDGLRQVPHFKCSCQQAWQRGCARLSGCMVCRRACVKEST